MNEEIRTAIEQFAERLRSKDLAVREGASPEQVNAFESRYGVHVPMDMVEFFLTVNGMDLGTMDPDNCIRVWSVDQLQPICDQLPEYAKSLHDAHRAFVVADYLVWSLGYVTWLDDRTVERSPVFLVGEGPPQRIAESFGEFVGLLAENSPGLLPLRP